MLKEIKPQWSICGVVVILDQVGTTLSHMKTLTPTVGKKMITVYEEGYPMRPKEMHMFNMPSVFETFFNIVKSFMKPKMRERLRVHPKNDFSQLHECVGKDILPEEYGGTNGTVQDHIDLMYKKVQANRKWILQQEKAKSNEKKRRSGMTRSYSDIFGMEGSFRQLSFD